jgi:hypothetical protein
MAFGLNLAIEVLNNTWSSPSSKKPTFKESVSKLKDIHFELDRIDLTADASERLADNAGILAEAFNADSWLDHRPRRTRGACHTHRRRGGAVRVGTPCR